MEPHRRHPLSQPTTSTHAASPARASSNNTLWRSRSTLYKFSILLLMLVWPLNFLSVVLPYWLQAEGKVGDNVSKDHVNYGFWTLCADGSGCYDVHSIKSDVGVGVWLYAAAFFTLLSVVCHAVASLCGALQNFLPRRISRECTCFLKRVLHRDCAYTEDVGFIAGFVGMTANIIVMMSTKDVVSDGATYSFSFALSFFSTAIALISSVALTKAHCISHPSPRRQSAAARAQYRDPVQVHHGGATASMGIRDSSPTGRVGLGSSASAAMELGDLTSLREQADTDSASLRVQLGAPFRGSGDSDATAYEQRRSRDGYDPERYSSGPVEPGNYREQGEPTNRYSDQRERYKDQRESYKDQRESSKDQRESHKDHNALQGADDIKRRSSHSHGEHENQAYVREPGDCNDANSRDATSSGSNPRQPHEHRNRQDSDEGYSRRQGSANSAEQPSQPGATAYWRGREEESTRPQDLDAEVLEESDQVREAERKTRWHSRTSSRSRSRSRSRERRHGRRQQSSDDSSPATTAAGNNSNSQATRKNYSQQPHSPGNSRTKGLVRSVEMENIHAAVSLGSSSSAKKHPLLNSSQPHSFGYSRTSGLMRSLEVENIPAAVSSAPEPSSRSTVPPSLRQQTPHTEHLRSSPLKRNSSPPASSKEPAAEVRVLTHDVRMPTTDVRNRNSRVSNSKATAGVEASRSTRL